MKRPPASRVGGDAVAQLLTGLDDNGVFAAEELAIRRFHLAPHSMQVDGVVHHAVVNEHNAQTLTVVESQRLALGELLAVERPDESLHVAGQVQAYVATRLAGVNRASNSM